MTREDNEIAELKANVSCFPRLSTGKAAISTMPVEDRRGWVTFL